MMQKKPKKIEDYNQLYTEADSADQEVFSEMRSNVLLVSGEQYQKRSSRFYQRIRDHRELSEQQKLRLVKNHLRKITNRYVNNILSHAPGVTIVPKSDNELSDQKTAELNKSVWQDAKQRHKLNKKIKEWCKDFIEIGECALKLFWDPSKGPVKAYEQLVDENGQPVFDAMGNPSPDESRPVMQGDFVFERVWAFNLLRAPEAKTWDDSAYAIVRKMVALTDLKIRYEGDEEKLSKIKEGEDETYVVFDGNRQNYSKARDQVLIREFYFKPCAEYPKGYFAITTKDGVLEEGELPFGLFPIVVSPFDEFQTTPRGRSAIKQLRPYQIEVNRCASKIAETQITLGDDKLVLLNGTKITNAGTLPGIRGISVNGMAPTVLPGRDGAQYLPYMQSQITEMYQVADLEEDDTPKTDGQTDPHALLYKALKQKKKFAVYGGKFEEFLVSVCELYLALAKQYLPDDMLIPAIGKAEFVNIPEFRTTTPFQYTVKVEPMSDDIETQMGKQLSINHLLQYTGSQLKREDIGRLARVMPFSNLEESFGDLTLDYDNATNDILALDRGEMPQVNPADNHEYIISRIVNRQKKADYKLLNQQIKQNYDNYKAQHEKIKAEQLAALQRAQSGFIPMGGYMVVCDLYVTDEKDPTKSKRVRVPAGALEWLLAKLKDQGVAMEQMQEMNPEPASNIAQMFEQEMSGKQGGMPQAQGGMPPQQ